MGNRFCYEIHNHAIVTMTSSISQDIFYPPRLLQNAMKPSPSRHQLGPIRPWKTWIPA